MWVNMEFKLKIFNNYKGVLCELLYCKKGDTLWGISKNLILQYKN